MAIAVAWYDVAEKILCWTFEATWTVDDYYQASNLSNRLTITKTYPIYLVVDMRAVTQFPAGILTHAVNGLSYRQENTTHILVILRHPTLRVLFHTFLRLQSIVTPKLTENVHLVTDWEEALTLLPPHIPQNHKTQLLIP